MRITHAPALLTAVLLLTLTSCGVFGDRYEAGQLSHDVYFRMVDPTPENVEGLVAACQGLERIDGIVEILVGTREESLARDVNQIDWHVALHIVFVDKAAHDAYQVDPIHTAFVDSWSQQFGSVRVFDWLLADDSDD